MPMEFLLMPVFLIVGAVIGYVFRRFTSEKLINGAENHAKKIVEDAIKEAETKKKEKLVEAKEEAHRIKQESDKENRERRNEIQKLERRLITKEENLDKKNENLDKKNERLNKELKALEVKETEIEKLVEKYVDKNGIYEGAIGLDKTGMKEVFETGTYEELIELPFEDMMVPAPKNYDKILTQFYGDYMKKPSDEEIEYKSHLLDAYRIK